VCPEALWPLFEWLCVQHDVEVVMAPVPDVADVKLAVAATLNSSV